MSIFSDKDNQIFLIQYLSGYPIYFLYLDCMELFAYEELSNHFFSDNTLDMIVQNHKDKDCQEIQ